MFFVTGNKDLCSKINNLLSEYFGDKADIKTDSHDSSILYVKVKVDAGFKDQEFRLTDEELKRGVIGGGLILGLDGKTFKIEVTEVDA